MRLQRGDQHLGNGARYWPNRFYDPQDLFGLVLNKHVFSAVCSSLLTSYAICFDVVAIIDIVVVVVANVILIISVVRVLHVCLFLCMCVCFVVVEGVVVDLHDDDYVFLLLMRHPFLLFMNTARSMRNRTQQKPQSFSIQRPSTSHNRQSTQSTRSSSKAARKMSAVIAIVSNTILFILNVLCIPNTHTF